MLRKKNALMRSGQVEKAAALAVKIGTAIRNYNSAELTRTDMLTDASDMWEKVRQLTGRAKNSASNENPAVTADTLMLRFLPMTATPHRSLSVLSLTTMHNRTYLNRACFIYWTDCGIPRLDSTIYLLGF